MNTVDVLKIFNIDTINCSITKSNTFRLYLWQCHYHVAIKHVCKWLEVCFEHQSSTPRWSWHDRYRGHYSWVTESTFISWVFTFNGTTWRKFNRFLVGTSWLSMWLEGLISLSLSDNDSDVYYGNSLNISI